MIPSTDNTTKIAKDMTCTSTPFRELFLTFHQYNMNADNKLRSA